MPKTVKCSCSFCDNNYHCPHCFTKPEIQSQCLREAEIRARELKIEREKAAEEARIKQDREEREQADLVLKWGGEFWGVVTGYVEESALYTAGAGMAGEGASSSATFTPGQGHNSDVLSGVVDSMAGVSLNEMDDEARIQLVAEILSVTGVDLGEETEEDAAPPAPAA